MGRMSVKENKSEYQRVREELHLAREQAEEEIKKIENGTYCYINRYKIQDLEDHPDKILPEHVVAFSFAYKKPELRNYYCCNDCAIGKMDARKATYKENVHQTLVNMLVSLESVNASKLRLMEILADGRVDDAETTDLAKSLEDLDRISKTASEIQLWCEKMKQDVK